MSEATTTFRDRLAPVEDIFFTWLTRVVLAGTLAGSAWLDDAPPLDIAAMLIAAYVAIRVIMQFGNLMNAAPFENRILSAGLAGFSIVVLGLSMMAVVSFVERLALSVAG